MVGGRQLFLDFDDTLSDPFLLHPQYVREVGAILAPQFGGGADDWAKATIDLLERLQREYEDRFMGRPLNGYCAWLAAVRETSADWLFEQMALAPPVNSSRVARETQFTALSRCSAVFPGAGDALADMNDCGWPMHMASGQESEYLTAALRGAGLAKYVDRKFGPDLIDCAKEGPEYYDRIFRLVGVRPSDAVVVDDYPPAIEWALQSGAIVIQSKMSRERRHEVMPGVAGVLTDLSELPALIQSICGAAGARHG